MGSGTRATSEPLIFYFVQPFKVILRFYKIVQPVKDFEFPLFTAHNTIRQSTRG